MAGIAPIPGGATPIGPTGIARPQAPAKQGGTSAFADTLKDYMSKVNQDQNNATSAIQDLVSGNSDDILPAVSAVAEADMSFKLLVGVRNKVIEAYKQTMNMQI